jgi:iron complex transport system ATP-binding protein
MGYSKAKEKYRIFLMAARDKILSISSLAIGYASGNSGNIILPHLDASAIKGEIVAVFGRNGIGKSTLLRTLAGLQPSLSGKILLSGMDITGYSRSELAKRIGYISTEVVKVNNMRVYDLVALGRFPHTNWIGKIDAESHEVIMGAIARTGMEMLKDRYISELSDGERQRAMIARVIAQETEIIIMDEPTAFLDIAGKYEIIRLLQEVAGEGRTIIFSTHDFSIALSNADKIWLIHNESLIEGSPEDLVVEGTFEHLFNSELVSFNSVNGTFSFRKESKGKIYVEGTGMLRQWTENAVIRAGYSVADIKTDPFISISQNTGDKLIYNSGDKKLSFCSIYDLVAYLTDQNY